MYADVVPVVVGNPPTTRPPVPGLTFQSRPALDPCDYPIPQSFDPVGLTVVFVDGSTRVVKAGVEPAVFWASVTPAGGELIGDGF